MTPESPYFARGGWGRMEKNRQSREKFTDKRVAGLIGSDFLLKHKAIIDYKRRELVLRNIRKS